MMNSEQWVRIIAGLMVLLSIALGVPDSPLYISQWFTLIAVFAGINLFQSGFTCWCLLEKILISMGIKDASVCVPRKS
jgi:hypothetical protein